METALEFYRRAAASAKLHARCDALEDRPAAKKLITLREAKLELARLEQLAGNGRSAANDGRVVVRVAGCESEIIGGDEASVAELARQIEERMRAGTVERRDGPGTITVRVNGGRRSKR